MKCIVKKFIIHYNKIPFLLLFVLIFNLHIHEANGSRIYNISEDQENKSKLVFKSKYEITTNDLKNFHDMEEKCIIPYQDIQAPTPKTKEDLIKLGSHYFPHHAYKRELATTVYDWTTANFFRIKLFANFRYTSLENMDIDEKSIEEQIWHANWGRYNPQNKYFMNSLCLIPIFSKEELKSKLIDVYEQLKVYNQAEINILNEAIKLLPRPKIKDVQFLFRGAGQLGLDYYGSHFIEFPGNNKLGIPMIIPIKQGLEDFLKEGNILTIKSPWSFTKESNLGSYNQGIVIVAGLPKDEDVWQCAYITPFSDNNTKDEYIFSSGTQFIVRSNQWRVTSRGETLFIYVEQISSSKFLSEINANNFMLFNSNLINKLINNIEQISMEEGKNFTRY